MNINPRYLFASVETAHLYITGLSFVIPITDDPQRDGSKHYLSLYDLSQNWVGILRPHDPKQFLARENNSTPNGQMVQLIAISRGSIPNHDALASGLWFLDEFDLGERPKDGENYEYYNVLWISWEDGIAYREAAGRVLKDMWESLKPESIDVILG